MNSLLGSRYLLGQMIGTGGMADVYIAQDQRLAREVAVKILRSDLARDPAFVARFRKEAKAAAGLNHPGIVAVYDSPVVVAAAAFFKVTLMTAISAVVEAALGAVTVASVAVVVSAAVVKIEVADVATVSVPGF